MENELKMWSTIKRGIKRTIGLKAFWIVSLCLIGAYFLYQAWQWIETLGSLLNFFWIITILFFAIIPLGLYFYFKGKR